MMWPIGSHVLSFCIADNYTIIFRAVVVLNASEYFSEKKATWRVFFVLYSVITVGSLTMRDNYRLLNSDENVGKLRVLFKSQEKDGVWDRGYC